MFIFISLIFSSLVFAQQNSLSAKQLMLLNKQQKIKMTRELNSLAFNEAEQLYKQVTNQLLSSLYIGLKSTINKLETNYFKESSQFITVLYENDYSSFCSKKGIKSKEVFKYIKSEQAQNAFAYYSICSGPTILRESIRLKDGAKNPMQYLIRGSKSFSVDINREHVFYTNEMVFGYSFFSSKDLKSFSLFNKHGSPFIEVVLNKKTGLLKLMSKPLGKTKFSLGENTYVFRNSISKIMLVVDYNKSTPRFKSYHDSINYQLSRLDFSMFLNAYFIQGLNNSYAYLFKALEQQLPQASEAIIQQNNKALIEELIVIINKIKQGSDTAYVTTQLEKLLKSTKEGKILDQRADN